MSQHLYRDWQFGSAVQGSIAYDDVAAGEDKLVHYELPRRGQ